MNAPGRAIEVETANTVRDGMRQLRGFRKPVYIAGSSVRATEAALEAAQGTTVGVMDPNGKIVNAPLDVVSAEGPELRFGTV